MQYERYFPMIKNRADFWVNSLSSPTGKAQQDYEELFCIGNLTFCEARASYEPTRAAFSTWLYFLLNQNMLEFVVREKNKMEVSLKEYNIVDRINTNWLVDFLDSVSKEASEVVSLVLNTPTEYIELLSGEIMKIADIKHCLTQKGWKQYTINVTIAEIRERLRES